MYTALQKLKPSRKKAQAGDVFRMRFADGRSVFGRVVKDAQLFGGPALLVYVYDTSAVAGEPALDDLRADRLLLPPMLTNEVGWRHGFFETVAHRALEQEDYLPTHCFHDQRVPPRFYDENGEDAVYSEPCGLRALDSYFTIAEQVLTALSHRPREGAPGG